MSKEVEHFVKAFNDKTKEDYEKGKLDLAQKINDWMIKSACECDTSRLQTLCDWMNKILDGGIK